MKNSLHVHTCSASREMILEMFRDQYRIALEYDPESEPDIPIEPETTIAELTQAFDWVRPKALGPALGADFGIEATRDEWLAVLTPEKQRTLGDICSFLVERGAELPVSRPLRIFGTECGTAGAFMAVRSLLAGEGIEVSGVRPSSDLATFVKKARRRNALLLTMSKLAPGVLPDPLVRHMKPNLQTIVGRLFLAGLFGFLFGGMIWAGGEISAWLGGPATSDSMMTGVLAVSTSFIAIAIASLIIIEMKWPSEHIARPGFKTFGDLARAVAAYEPPASSE